ncbi:hypothetical protein ACFQU2_30465 [Siccirubricoccus deserti]
MLPDRCRSLLFRTAEAIGSETIARLRGAGVHEIESLFAASPPAAIFGGLFADRRMKPMDAPLRDYAERHGYSQVHLPPLATGMTAGWLFIRPGAAPASADPIGPIAPTR